jgi:hypothetical protein
MTGPRFMTRLRLTPVTSPADPTPQIIHVAPNAPAAGLVALQTAVQAGRAIELRSDTRRVVWKIAAGVARETDGRYVVEPFK